MTEFVIYRVKMLIDSMCINELCISGRKTFEYVKICKSFSLWPFPVLGSFSVETKICFKNIIMEWVEPCGPQRRVWQWRTPLHRWVKERKDVYIFYFESWFTSPDIMSFDEQWRGTDVCVQCCCIMLQMCRECWYFPFITFSSRVFQEQNSLCHLFLRGLMLQIISGYHFLV